MANPLNLSLLITADAKGVAPATAEAKREIDAVGTSAREAATGTKTLSAANDEATASAKATTAATTGQAAAERALRQSVAEVTGARQATVAAATAQSAALGATAGAAKLTSNQMLNLSRQGNDVITMFALGASPMQIFASQAGQVYGALQEGPGGVAGSLKIVLGYLRGLASPLNLTIAGLTAAAAAGIYFATRTTHEIKPLNEALKAHEKALEGIAAAYGLAIDKAKEYAKTPSPAVATFQFGRSQAELQLSAQKTLADNFKPGLSANDFIHPGLARGGPIYGKDRVDDEYKAFETPLLKLNEQLKIGKGKATEFVDEVAKIANQDPANDKLRDLAGTLIDDAEAAAEAERRLKAMGFAIDDVTRAAQKAYRAGQETLKDFIPDPTSDVDRITRVYRQQINASNVLAGSPRAAEGIRTAATNDYNKALDEIARKEDNIRKGRDLDLREATARTAAEKAEIAAERERIALATEEGDRLSDTEKKARVAAASALVFAAAAKSAADRLRSSQASHDAAGLDGYAAALANINQRYAEEIAAAEGAGKAIGDLQKARALDIQTAQIEAQQNLIRPQQEQLAQLNAEAAALGKSDDARRRTIDAMKAEADIRRAGIDANGQLADSYRKNAAALSDYEARIKRTGDAWDEAKKAGESAIDDIVDKLSAGDLGGAAEAAAKDIEKTFLQLAVSNPLKNALLGTSYGTLGDLFSGKPAAPDLATAGFGALGASPFNALWVRSADGAGGGLTSNLTRLLTGGNDNDPWAGLRGVGAAPAGDVIRKPLADISDTLAKSASAIRSIESSGNYSALGPITASGDRAYGAYGVMGANVPSWTKAALGKSLSPSEFLGSKTAQDVVFNNRFGGYLDQYGPSGAAQAWFGGAGSVGGSGNGADILGTTGSKYVEKFNSQLQAASRNLGGFDKLGGSIDSLTSATKTGAIGLNDLGNGFDRFGNDLKNFFPAAPGGGGGGLGGLLGKLLGGPSALRSSFMSDISPGVANVIASGGIGLFASGGISDRPAIFGEGPLAEAAVPLPDGRSIPVSLRMQSSSRGNGGNVYVNVTNNGEPADVSTRQRTDADGNRHIEVVLTRKIKDEVLRPSSPTNRQLRGTYGLTQQLVDR